MAADRSNPNIICELIDDKDSTNLADNRRLNLLMDQARYIDSSVLLKDLQNDHFVTRILCYSSTYCIDQSLTNQIPLNNFLPDFNIILKKVNCLFNTVHSVEFVLVLHLSRSSTFFNDVDRILQNMRQNLKSSNVLPDLTSNEVKALAEVSIDCIHVYSKIPSLLEAKTLPDMYRKIQNIQRNIAGRTNPLEYIVKWVQIYVPVLSWSFSLTDDHLLEKFQTVEDQMINLSEKMKVVKSFWTQKHPIPIRQYLGNHLFNIFNGYASLLQLFICFKHRWSFYVVDLRNAIPENHELTSLAKHINEFTAQVQKIPKKVRFIQELHDSGIDYFDHSARENTTWTNTNHELILCSSDELNAQYALKLQQLRQQLIEAYRNNPQLCLKYLDYSYTISPLEVMKIIPTIQQYIPTCLPSAEGNHTLKLILSKSHSIQELSTPLESSDISSRFNDDLSSKTNSYTNILLLGESGVGKSTFINALANYLRSSSLQEALTNPIVVIPVSFLITTGFNFDEQVMYFGDCRNRDNENFNNHGQSVTQQCQEYEFDVPTEGGTRRIRIIDTPGFGDTRGIEQDQKNINHIKDYIKRYQKLDAICFLLRPNEARLNVAFRLCFSQLTAVLGEKSHENLLFCFTNTRSTFYAPGNTGPLLKKMLTDWHMDHITLTKENTFCFDNESFRYLVAKMHRVKFGVSEEKEYERSWTTSVKESKRLLDRIS